MSQSNNAWDPDNPFHKYGLKQTTDHFLLLSDSPATTITSTPITTAAVTTANSKQTNKSKASSTASSTASFTASSLASTTASTTASTMTSNFVNENLDESEYDRTLALIKQLDKQVVTRDGTKNIPCYFRNDFRAQREKLNPYGMFIILFVFWCCVLCCLRSHSLTCSLTWSLTFFLSFLSFSSLVSSLSLFSSLSLSSSLSPLFSFSPRLSSLLYSLFSLLSLLSLLSLSPLSLLYSLPSLLFTGTRGSKNNVILTKDLNITGQLNPMACSLIEVDPLARQYAKQRALKLFRQKKNIVNTNLMLPPVARSFIPRQYVQSFCRSFPLSSFLFLSFFFLQYCKAAAA